MDENILSKKGINLAIFDLDGTLLDTSPGIMEVLRVLREPGTLACRSWR